MEAQSLPAVPGTRQRIIAAASDLFYRDGISATGVDAVVARAHLSKPTLYRHFPSKELLVEAYLIERDRLNREALESVLARHDDPTDRLLAVFDWLGEWHNEPEFHGCAFARAAAELDSEAAGAFAVIRARKTWLRSRLLALCKEAQIPVPVQFSDALMLLVEGATTTAFVEGDKQSALKAKRVARALITLFRSPSQ